MHPAGLQLISTTFLSRSVTTASQLFMPHIRR